jgi:hypothetical protein
VFGGDGKRLRLTELATLEMDPTGPMGAPGASECGRGREELKPCDDGAGLDDRTGLGLGDGAGLARRGLSDEAAEACAG